VNPEKYRDIQSFLRFFVIALSNARMYSPGHPQTRRMLNEAASILLSVLDNETSLSFLLFEDHIVVGEARLPGSIFTERFAKEFFDRGCSNVVFYGGITDKELMEMIEAMAGKGEETILRDSSVVSFGRILLDADNKFELPTDKKILLTLIEEIPDAEFEQFRDIYEAIKEGRRFHVSGLYNIVGSFIKAVQDEADVLRALAPLRILDSHTFMHSANICLLNLAQSLSLGFRGQILHDIGVASLLHDIGKLFVPEEILNKSGGLTSEESDIMCRHPLYGARYLMDNPGVPRVAIAVAFEHHLKYDLTGYPRVPDAWQQNICSHMTAISDFFDAAGTTRDGTRIYDKESIGISILQQSGTTFHPTLARKFLLLLDSMSSQ
jgi:HD-GYP domain-containing protein (c-di-GMP phosphodiesterase class II)